MSLRCHAHDIKVIEPPADSRLENPQSEQERRYKLAITELNETKNRSPKLKLVLSEADASAPSSSSLVLEVNPSVEDREI